MSNQRTKLIFVCLLALFIIVRLPGLSLPYHQDEFKNIIASESTESVSGLTHPPLLQIWFLLGHFIFGGENFRFWPLFFSFASWFLLFATLRRRAGEQAAYWSVFLFTFSFYAIWSSLMVDVDGSLLLFFSILAFYVYDRWRRADNEIKNKWLILLGLSLLLGFLVKLSFVLIFAALILDFLWKKRRDISFRKIIIFLLALVSFSSVLTSSFIAFEVFFPPFDWRAMLVHADYYAEGSRNYLQIIVQALKAVFYLSPLLLAPLFFLSRETIKRLRPFFLYILLGIVFYFGLFDFSRGALDKYLMYLIVPLAAIGGEVINRVMAGVSTRQIKLGLLIGGVLAVGLLALNFLPHEVLPLYPKTEWFSRALAGRWLMLNPFTGGSGPLGFYLSFLFIILSFVVSLGLIFIGWVKKTWRPVALTAMLAVGAVYNLTMSEELFFGRINGSAPQALNQALTFIGQSPIIKSVITYNDIGAYELVKMGKYAGRFYAAPQFETAHQERFAKHNQESGYYLAVEMPLLYNGFYKEFFSRCQSLWSARSRAIPVNVYKCPL